MWFRVIIKAVSEGRESGPKDESKFGQSNNNTELAPKKRVTD